MMSPPGTYFVTFSTWQRRRLFVVQSYVRLFLKAMYGYKRQGKFQLHSFVLMPEHVHLLLTPASDVTLERAVQLIRGGYSRAFGLEFGAEKSGKEDLPTIAFVTLRIASRIGIISIRTP
jgi:REP element-mobilizing transposase RayT